jgi:hypothetical protein
VIGAVRAGMVLDLLLARQAGVISREQALRVGLDAATVDRKVRTRRWRPLHPRVYLAPGYELGDEARARAAVLWAGSGAVLAGVAAAWWHGLLPDAPPTLGVTVSDMAPGRRAARPGVAVRYRPLDRDDRTRHRGLPVTAVGLTVLEAATELGGPAGECLLDRALRDRVGWPEVIAAHRRNPALVTDALLAAAAGRAAAEAGVVLVRLLRGAGWRGWHLLPASADRPVTVVFPAARVAVEAVGVAVGTAGRALGAARAPACIRTVARTHLDRDPRTGWRVLRVGRRELAGRPASVLAAIAAAVEGRDLHHPEARIGPSTGKWR